MYMASFSKRCSPLNSELNSISKPRNCKSAWAGTEIKEKAGTIAGFEERVEDSDYRRGLVSAVRSRVINIDPVPTAYW